MVAKYLSDVAPSRQLSWHLQDGDEDDQSLMESSEAQAVRSHRRESDGERCRTGSVLRTSKRGIVASISKSSLYFYLFWFLYQDTTSR